MTWSDNHPKACILFLPLSLKLASQVVFQLLQSRLKLSQPLHTTHREGEGIPFLLLHLLLLLLLPSDFGPHISVSCVPRLVWCLSKARRWLFRAYFYRHRFFNPRFSHRKRFVSRSYHRSVAVYFSNWRVSRYGWNSSGKDWYQLVTLRQNKRPTLSLWQRFPLKLGYLNSRD